MLNKRYHHKLLKASLLLSLNFNLFIPQAFSLEQLSLTQNGRLHIAQESFKTNGVLVSRPKVEDIKISNLIHTHKINSLEDYSSWLKNHIKYIKDGIEDTWLSAEKLLNLKEGDCEDYTFLNTAVLRVLGYKPQFIALVRPGKPSHAICLFQKNGYYLWFDNAHLIKTNTRTFDELARYITHQYNYSYLLELDPHSRNWTILYKKS